MPVDLTITIGVSTIFTIATIIYKYRHVIREIFMKSKTKVKRQLIKRSIDLLNLNIKQYIKGLSDDEDPQSILSFMQELEEKFKLRLNKGDK